MVGCETHDHFLHEMLYKTFIPFFFHCLSYSSQFFDTSATDAPEHIISDFNQL